MLPHSGYLIDCPNTQPHTEACLDVFPDFPEGSHCFYTMKVAHLRVLEATS